MVKGLPNYFVTPAGKYPAWFSIYQDASNRMQVFNSPSTSHPTWEDIATGTDYFNMGLGNFSSTSTNSIAAVYNTNDFIAASNGALGSPISSGLLPSAPIAIYFGSTSGNNYLNGWLQAVQYYNSRLTNTQIQNLTH